MSTFEPKDPIVSREDDPERDRQRTVFGEVAETYDAVRPEYPDAIFDRIMELSQATAGDRALDVGAGTGKATLPLALRGLSVTAIEPDPAMAAVARLRCRGHDVTVVEAEFEAWRPTAPSRVVVAAQAWHWLRPDVAPRLVAEALEPRGWVALIWNRPGEWNDDLRRELDDIYARIATSIRGRSAVIAGSHSGAERQAAADLEASGRFGAVHHERLAWSRRYDRATYTALLTTHSDHRLLPAETLAALTQEVGAAIDRAGGAFDHPYVTHLVAAPVLRRE
jgi:SAM-dependent methyltransferase